VVQPLDARVANATVDSSRRPVDLAGVAVLDFGHLVRDHVKVLLASINDWFIQFIIVGFK